MSIDEEEKGHLCVRDRWALGCPGEAGVEPREVSSEERALISTERGAE